MYKNSQFATCKILNLCINFASFSNNFWSVSGTSQSVRETFTFLVQINSHTRWKAERFYAMYFSFFNYINMQILPLALKLL